jgi:hypothetical protein
LSALEVGDAGRRDQLGDSAVPIKTLLSALTPENRRPRSAPRSTGTNETILSSAAPENLGGVLAVDFTCFQSHNRDAARGRSHG